MGRILGGVLALAMTFGGAVVAQPATPGRPAATVSAQEAERAFAALPLAFEPNRGQADGRARFVARGAGYSVAVADEAVALGLAGSTVSLRIEGKRAGARLVAERELPGRSHYLRGSDPSRWLRDVPRYGAVRYEGVYEGVDAVFYGTGSLLEYDFVVAPGADPSQIRVRFEGHEGIEVAEDGSLVLRTPAGELRQRPAVAFQEGTAGKRAIGVGYTVGPGGEVGFELGEYDRKRPLTIDPVLVFEQFIGGGMAEDGVSALALGADGSAYAAGTTRAIDLPGTSGSADSSWNGAIDAFVVKLSPDGRSVEYATYLGGNADDRPNDIAVDASGAVYVVGRTGSFDFPVTPGAYDVANDPPTNPDAFVVKIAPSGTAVAFGSFLGNYGVDEALAVALGPDGSVFVAGKTSSAEFPTTPGAFDVTFDAPSDDAFVARMSADGTALLYSTFLGGGSIEAANALAVDAAGAAYVAGVTGSSDFPTTPGAFDAEVSNTEGFVTKIAPSGAALELSTLVGGSGGDLCYDLELLPSGETIVVGNTTSADFPATAGAYDVTYNGMADAFVARLASDGGSLLYATYLGGPSDDNGFALAAGPDGSPVVVGLTGLGGFPTTAGALDTTLSGGDGFVARLTPDGATLTWSTLLGGSLTDAAVDVAVDSAGAAYVAGGTSSRDFPTRNSPLDLVADSADGFVAKLDPSGTTLDYSTLIGGDERQFFSGGGGADDSVVGVAFDGSGAVYLAGYTGPGSFPSTPGSFDPVPDQGAEAFVVKLDPTGALVYSTFLGGAHDDIAEGLAALEDGSVLVGGHTKSPDFPTTEGAYDRTFNEGIVDGFVVKVSPDGGSLAFGTFLGGSGADLVTSLAVDGSRIHVAGYTTSADHPVTPDAVSMTQADAGDGYLVRLDVSGASVAYGTYLGAVGHDKAESVAIDPSGASIVGGVTQSAAFPVTPGAFDTTFEGAQSGFVAKIDAAGALAYATYLGGSRTTEVWAVGVDAAGEAVAAGYTEAPNFPTTPGAFDTTSNLNDAFVAKLDPTGSTLVYSTLLGGPMEDKVYAVAVRADGAAFVTGGTGSADFPTTPDALHPTRLSSSDAFVAEVSPDGSRLVYSTFLGAGGGDQARAIALDPPGRVVVGGVTTSTDGLGPGIGTRDERNGFVALLDLGQAADVDTAAIFAPSTSTWYAKNANAPGNADVTFDYGVGGSGFVPLVGDWDGDGSDTPGLYDPATGTFFLRDALGGGDADHVFIFGAGGAGYVPIAGDWDGDGADTIGLYHPPTGSFFLRNALDGGAADVSFFFGAAGGGFEVIAGDWNGDGVETIGLYRASTATFFLRDQHATGPADLTFIYGGPGLRAVAGDWNGDGRDTIGVVDVGTATWFLRNENASGAADLTFIYGVPGVVPLVGNW
jgi:hypothetical protein